MPTIYGYLYVLGLMCSTLVQSLAINHYFFIMFTTGVVVSLIIYKKIIENNNMVLG